VVFIVGLEENILPHSRSIEPERRVDPSPAEQRKALEALEEERRLFYVGITRAEDQLYLLYASIRSLYGDSRANLPSRFLYDIPEHARDGSALRQRGQSQRDQMSYRAMTSWLDRTASSEDRPAKKSKSAGRPAAPTRFKGGDNVWHSKYGEGIVVSSTIAAGNMEQVEVLFPGGAGQKTILADFLKPMEG
jgi:DNA helicase-2/ATP-dependent DNA helicase PcrA